MSRTVAITADSPPSDYGTSNDQQTARHLLRENWCMLVGSFTSAATAGITDTLYEKKIISEEEMENIQCKTTRKYMARSLLSVMSTKSWTQCLTFCDLVHQREGMEDIGTKLLETAGRLDASGQSLDKPCRAEDVLKLYEGNQALKVLRHSFKVYARQQHLTETSLRRQLEKLEGVPYLKQDMTVRKTLPQLPQNKTSTVNCVAAVGNTTVATYCNASDMYNFEIGSEEWTVQEGFKFQGAINNVFSNQNACFVAAESTDYHKIFRWSLDSHTLHPITDIPEHFRHGTHSGMITNDEYIYTLGGLHGRQPLDTATVYDMKSEKWRPLPNMPFTSFFCSSAFINNTLYVAGGRTENSSGTYMPVTEVAALHLNESNWRKITELNSGQASVTALQDRLIATGGESRDGHAVSNVDVFDVISGQWLPLSHMTASRCRHGVCVTENNNLVAVGGAGSLTCETLHF